MSTGGAGAGDRPLRAEGPGAVRVSTGGARVGVLLVNFGEPDEPTVDKVEAFLERIFLQNADLEPTEPERARARRLARDRAPGLVDEYRSIGGSPLNRQANEQAAALADTLRAGGGDWRVYSAFQFTAPFIADKVAEARADGVEVLAVVPVYPLCGRSTTVAALETARSEVERAGWSPRLVAVAGWHAHPDYEAMWADRIRGFLEERGLDLNDPDTLLYFSVHGTPIKYLDEGNRYDRYVEEQCRGVARRLGADRYAVGFQNHTNRRVAWTQPDNEAEIASRPERRLVVVPISFMHEQSETLAEIDHELRAYVEGLDKELHRVPVPHDAPEFGTFLADLVIQLVDGRGDVPLDACRCAPLPGVWCTNGARELPPSPYARAAPGA